MIKVIGHARDPYAEIVRHSGAHACKFGGEPYTDNSRTSVVCPAHREEYRRKMSKQRSNRKNTVDQTVEESKNHA